MDLKHLRYFKVLAEELNFRKAAARLNISQPPLSQQIKELEESLETSLFHRLKKGNELTDAGKILYQYTLEIFEKVEEAEERIRSIREKKTGKLILGLVPGIRPQRIAKAMQLFQKIYPDIQVTIAEHCTATLIHHVKENMVDLALVYGPVQEDALEWNAIAEEAYHVVLPANHALAKRKKISREDLKDQPFILYKRQDQPWFHDAVMQQLKFNGQEPNIISELSSPRTRVLLVHQGLGLTFAPASLHEEYPHVSFKPLDSLDAVPVGILRKRNKNSRTLKTMMEAFQKSLS
ncbi:LysR family transcriptional regulator [Ohtaekwangia koreensis]|uniref:DNA-binding transcriptional regulator, LysR family n=1 Tax=Ohtaekwangia koreensis TaxID=688867 RepID=A0A1T5JX61_9BACT|nr:LysR family transcriptional regulator [Ohtaekwangia koreensis]SKC55987.1 DNA-binding transcriptional regulator, LysR family [Ohtaekwangia koreensis]